MAIDKAVDSTQLDGAIGATADAIRAKTGDSAAIAWDMDAGFASAIAAIASGGAAAGGLAYDMGEFVLEEDATMPVIPHNLGAVPGLILVWTEEFAGITENARTYHTNSAMIYLSNPWGTSAAPHKCCGCEISRQYSRHS